MRNNNRESDTHGAQEMLVELGKDQYLICAIVIAYMTARERQLLVKHANMNDQRDREKFQPNQGPYEVHTKITTQQGPTTTQLECK